METVLHEAAEGEEKILVRAEKIIRAVQLYSRKHGNYINMYNEITSGSSKKFAMFLAKEIESLSSKTYVSFIEEAKSAGDLRTDMDSRLFAFFFDNLLTMLQFSYCCDYHKERMKIYCGEDIFDDDEKVVTELLKFIESAFTFSQTDLTHENVNN